MKKTILLLSPGPNYWPNTDSYRGRFEELSKTFKGYIFTTSSQRQMLSMGSFTFHSIKYVNSLVRVPLFVFFCAWNAVKLRIKKQKVDLVVSYDPFLTGAIGAMVALMLKAKFIPEVNGVYTSDAEWIDFQDTAGVKLKRRVGDRIMRFVMSSADAVKVLFPGQLSPFKDLLKDKPVQHYPNFIPVDSFSNLCEKNEILFVGFPFKRKGVDILIAAFKQLAPKFPDWKLKILGWYPDPTELNSAIAGHPQIFHHKPVPRQEMPDHIGSCAILVLPSRSEAMGRVLVEAMAAGKPRVGSNVDGIPAVINNGVDGVLFEPENVGDLASKLEMLMSNPAMRRKLGNAGAMRAKHEFTREEYCKNVVKFYGEVLSR